MKLALVLIALCLTVISTTIGCTSTAKPKSTPTASPVPVAQPTQPTSIVAPTTAPASPTPSQIIHLVEAGETLSAIAAKYNTTVDTILAANPDIKDPNFISIGQEIVIPAR